MYNLLFIYCLSVRNEAENEDMIKIIFLQNDKCATVMLVTFHAHVLAHCCKYQGREGIPMALVKASWDIS